MFRLWFKTFFGESRFDERAVLEEHGAAVHSHAGTHAVMVAEHDESQASHSHGIHESPWVMLFPLVILAILSFIGGWVGVPAALWGHNEIEHFLDPVFGAGANAVASTTGYGVERTLALVSVATAVLGLSFAWLFYCTRPGTAATLAARFKPIYATLDHKYWVDEFYSNFLVTPLLMFTRITEFVVNQGVVEGSGAAAGAITRGLSKFFRRQMSGNIRSYAGWLAFGAAVVLVVMTFGRSLWRHS
jgi:NADH-quinone oxidoreductase subunit L